MPFRMYGFICLYIKLVKDICECEYPDHIFCNVGYKTPGKLVNKHEEEKKKTVIVCPHLCIKEKKYFNSETQEKPNPAKNSKCFCCRIRNYRGKILIIEIIVLDNICTQNLNLPCTNSPVLIAFVQYFIGKDKCILCPSFTRSVFPNKKIPNTGNKGLFLKKITIIIKTETTVTPVDKAALNILFFLVNLPNHINHVRIRAIKIADITPIEKEKIHGINNISSIRTPGILFCLNKY